MSPSRRDFVVGLGAMLAASRTHAAEPAKSDSNRPAKADVMVVGGGTAGTIAAIQAARLGARTVLVEAGSQLGGTTTTAGVDIPGLFHAWGRQVIAGIGWDLVVKTVELNGNRLPDFTKPVPTHSKHQVRMCGQLYAALAEEACVEAGVELRYYESPTSIEKTADGWKVHLVGKGTQADYTVRQLIDTTGNASVVGMIGLARSREATIQPGTLIYRLGGYDLKSLNFTLLEREGKRAFDEGRLRPGDIHQGGLRGFLGGGGENAMHIFDADSSTSVLHTQTNIRGRQSLLRMVRFLKKQPGMENLRIERLQPEAGIRETFRIVGRTTITVDDYTSGRHFDDAVAYAFYPVDLHDAHGVRPKPLAQGVVPTIPLGALIPADSRNLMAAGRSISSDRLANSALRVQASCMAMGQAAGATAALAVQRGATPHEVPIEEVRRTLAKHGAIVPKQG